VYGVLDQLEDAAWITGQWEDQHSESNKPAAASTGSPPPASPPPVTSSPRADPMRYTTSHDTSGAGMEQQIHQS
jgi:hypothetical protein